VVDNAGDVVSELAAEGNDTVQTSLASYSLAPNVENLTLVATGAANGTGNTLNNILTAGAGSNVLDGGAGVDTASYARAGAAVRVSLVTGLAQDTGGSGSDTLLNIESLAGSNFNDALTGNAGANTLNGGLGQDVLEGGAGNDVLTDGTGNAYFSGGAGDDRLTGGTGTEVHIGGVGNDTLTTGNGADVILYNRGDGVDTINGGVGTDNTVSLGGGIRYADLALRKSASDLILDVSATESLTFKNWYVTTANNKSVAKLQVILDATADYDAASSNPLLNKKVEQFDFAGLATAFDQALAANPGLSSWALSGALASYHLAATSGDAAALGGDLAYYYGKNGNLSGMTTQAAQDVIGSASLGTANQTLRPFAGISGGVATLS
jgi:Ca2+-binding RTX toxin-like protein